MLVNTDYFDNILLASVQEYHPALKLPEKRKPGPGQGVILLLGDSFLPELESDICERYFVRKISDIGNLVSHHMKVDYDVLICCFENELLSKAELCKQIKSVESTALLPMIILLNRNVSMQTRMLFYKAGANEVLCFPAEQPLLFCKIQSILNLRNRMKEQYSKLTVSKWVNGIPADDLFMKNAINALEENVTDSSFKSSEFCKKINVSRSTLYRKFKDATGRSPNKVITDTRLKLAAKILRQKKPSISCLAYNLGFSSPSYFTKIFRLKYKMTPTEYHYFHSNIF